MDLMPLHDPDDLRETVARHDEQIKDHDAVIRELRDHLRQLVTRFDQFEKKVLAVSLLFFSNTHQGERLLSLFGL